MRRLLDFRLFFIYLILSLFFISFLPFFGAETLPFSSISELFSKEMGFNGEILFYHRLPRTLLAYLCGFGLASCGFALQLILKNPLADPFVLGIAGSAALGASLALSFPFFLFYWGPFSSVQFLAFSGAFLAVLFCLKMSSRFNYFKDSVILAGVTINILCGALILFIRYWIDPSHLVFMDRWLMGGLDVLGWDLFTAFLPLVLIAAFLLFPTASALNLIAFDEAFAEANGVHLNKLAFRVCLATAFFVGASVAISGPIGFVGLIVPHIVRKFSGSEALQGLLFSGFAGGIFLLLCDTLARLIFAPAELPVGILTALIGGPFFLRILWSVSE